MSEEKVSSRGLFEVRAINKDTDEIVFSDEVIAEGEKEALFDCDLKVVLREKGLKRDDVHILVREFGAGLPPKERPKAVRLFDGFGRGKVKGRK